MPRRRISGNRAGFAFLESLVSVAILSAVLCALLSAFVFERMNAALMQHHMEAINYARSALEQYLNNGSTTYVLPTGTLKNLGGACVVGVSAFGQDLNMVTVTVSWREQALGVNIDKSEQIITLLMT